MIVLSVAQSPGQETANAVAIVDALAKSCCTGNIDDITEFHFTFHSKSPSAKIDRTWQWFPKTEDIIYTGKDPYGEKTTIEYSRRKLATLHKDFQTIDSWFVNDRYWLLSPLYLSKEAGVAFSVSNSAVMPISGQWATALAAVYSTNDPGRPGRKLEFYIDSTNRVREWVCYPAGSRQILANKWLNYKKIGDFTLSLDRPCPDSKGTQVWFTNVAVKK